MPIATQLKYTVFHTRRGAVLPRPIEAETVAKLGLRDAAEAELTTQPAEHIVYITVRGTVYCVHRITPLTAAEALKNEIRAELGRVSIGNCRAMWGLLVWRLAEASYLAGETIRLTDIGQPKEAAVQFVYDHIQSEKGHG